MVSPTGNSISAFCVAEFLFITQVPGGATVTHFPWTEKIISKRTSSVILISLPGNDSVPDVAAIRTGSSQVISRSYSFAKQ